MELVAGLSLKNLLPRVWDPASPFFLPALPAVMVSYADFHRRPNLRQEAMARGLHAFLGVPIATRVFLDNGAFYFSRQGTETPAVAYEEFVAAARPDWKPIPHDSIPAPRMTRAEQTRCRERTMEVNRSYCHDGFVPVIHLSEALGEYLTDVRADSRLAAKPGFALGGIVPHLLRTRRARAYRGLLSDVRRVRQAFAGKHLHLFGVGGTATLHLAALLGMDSVDSSGWRNRAARGIVQLPGSGDRVTADLGKWRGRVPSATEWAILRQCHCPACRAHGLDGLKAGKQLGFSCRATHNLAVLLDEVAWFKAHSTAGTYWENLGIRLDNSIYRPLIEEMNPAQCKN